MAGIFRSPKSRSDWTRNELAAYNISVETVDAPAFFTVGPNPPLDNLDPNLLTAPAGAVNIKLSDSTVRYLGYLHLAVNAPQEGLIDDFARETLHLLGFEERDVVLSTGYSIPLSIWGEPIGTAQTDVCLLHRRGLVLVVLITDKPPSSAVDAESHAIAEAIAAFQFNNRKRESRGIKPLPFMMIPCIIMSGTRPTFYLVPVTLELSTAVAKAQYPASKTTVVKCVTSLTRNGSGSESAVEAEASMKDPQYRKLALQRFLAFKSLARSHWEVVLRDLQVNILFNASDLG
ncbi:hypothetical protein C8R46DRAFT_1269476 [Mycena filopes]|nr:hypothetical protein C8R46DRAFT_1269476 [Mycena filopes]